MKPLQAITEYFKSSQAEFKKVAWPTRQDTIRYSALIVGISVVLAGFFALLDTGLNTTVETLLSRQTTAAPSAPAAPVQPTTQDVNVQPVKVDATTPSGQPANVTVTPGAVAPAPAPAPAPTK